MKKHKPCSCIKKPKQLPYGSRRGKYWCFGCDANLVGDYVVKPIKKSERQKAKKLIKNELIKNSDD